MMGLSRLFTPTQAIAQEIEDHLHNPTGAYYKTGKRTLDAAQTVSALALQRETYKRSGICP
jgi:hypothetical protein